MDSKRGFPRSYCSFLFTLGIFSQVQTLVTCGTSCSSHRRCGVQPGGVHDLDCFGKREVRGTKAWRCEWQPGVGASKKTYTIVVQQQGNYCVTKTNVTGLSEKIKIFENKNMTASVVENPDFQNCSKAIFTGSPKTLLRCGPPLWSSFSRRSGLLDVDVGWLQQERRYIDAYEVRYKAMGDPEWKFPKIHGNGSALDRLNSSQVYEAQVKCAPNDGCPRCPWSDPFILPAELKAKPVINLEEVDSPDRGSRLLSLRWKTPEEERPHGYRVDVQKASGEPPRDRFNTTRAQATLKLSCSAYTVTISAFNNVSESPARTLAILGCDPMTVLPNSATLKHNRIQCALTIQCCKVRGFPEMTPNSCPLHAVHWEARLLKSYSCYSVELSRTAEKVTYFSFFENTQSKKSLDLTEPLEPFKKYSLFLHLRTNKHTCNLKSTNSSEQTYGSTHFYFKEGTPLSAPANISYHNVTATSLVLQWSPIPEDDLRGFLLGYSVYYKEYDRDSRTAEKTVSVDAGLTSCTVEGLRPATGYSVQVSGYTRAGTGAWSIPGIFKTHEQAYEKDSVVILAFVATIMLLIVACPLLKRTKVIIWPSIPTPENSNAIGKIEKLCEVELLEPLQTMKLEECDTHGLQIILSSSVALAAENREDSLETSTKQDQSQTISDDVLGNAALTEQDGCANSQTPPTCGYSTLQMFQDAVQSQSVGVEAGEPGGMLLSSNQD